MTTIRQAVDAVAHVERPADRAAAASAFVQRLADVAIAIVREVDAPVHLREGWLGVLLIEAADVRSIARAMMRTRRPKLADTERTAFVAEVGAEYTQQFCTVMARYMGQRVTVREATVGANATVLVMLDVTAPDDSRETVTLRVYETAGRLRVVDVIWQGTSMVSNRGAKFDTSYRRTRKRA